MDQEEETNGDEDEVPGALTRKSLEAKLKEAQERLARYEGYQKLMEESGVSLLSLTDTDAKLMKNKNGFAVAYNPQTAVDSETHLIRTIIEVVADKGYEDVNDMASCLEKGIIPHVITDDGKDDYEIEIPYEEAEVDLSSTKPEELKKALHAGQIPKVYEEVIQDMKVETVKRKIKDNIQEADSVYGNSEEMLEKSKEG